MLSNRDFYYAVSTLLNTSDLHVHFLLVCLRKLQIPVTVLHIEWNTLHRTAFVLKNPTEREREILIDFLSSQAVYLMLPISLDM